MTDIDTLANAVKEQLNVAASQNVFDPNFTVRIDDHPEFDARAIESLDVSLLPHGVTLNEQTRAHDKVTHTLQIAFRQHAPTPHATGVDPLDEMAVKLRKLQTSVMTWVSNRVRRQPIANGPKLVGISSKPLYDAEFLRAQRTFIGVIELTYEEIARVP